MDNKLAMKAFERIAYSQPEVKHVPHFFEDLKWL